MSMDNRYPAGYPFIDVTTGEVLDPVGQPLRTGYNYDMDAMSDATGLACLEPSLTQQQFLEDADINSIANRYGLTGEMPTSPLPPEYGDYTGISDYRTAIHHIREAEDAFMAFPASLRARFDNDPAQFEAFVLHPANKAELQELGIIKKAAEAPSVPTGKPAGEASAPEKSGKS